MIAVFGTRGDVGVTTIASAAAGAFHALVDGRVALAEFDQRSVRARAEAARLDVTPPAFVRSNGRDPEADERLLIPGADTSLARRSDGLWTLVPLRRRTPAPADAKSVTLTLDTLRAGFAVTVAELEHQVNERTLAAFDGSDRIVMVTEGTVPSLRGTQRVLRLCHRLNYPDEKMCVVVNRYDAAGTIPVADIASILKREVYWKIAVGEPVDARGLVARLLGA
ncbi:MAG TPA: hypothetical protein VFZ21_13695 [Gemmatimonadaceae bacterium]|nr:hypothetical protein [Gemmatimonadaceae bacterium]